MEQYLIYLRKSRSDLEAEAHGEGETLSRHEHTLLELAKRQHLNVTDIYREVVSGDTIAARPMMQRVLSEVEQGVWSGVLVMEVERLARGDTIDQGIIAQTFKFSGTKIITPIKTYDPDNEFDEEYFESLKLLDEAGPSRLSLAAEGIFATFKKARHTAICRQKSAAFCEMTLEKSFFTRVVSGCISGVVVLDVR